MKFNSIEEEAKHYAETVGKNSSFPQFSPAWQKEKGIAYFKKIDELKSELRRNIVTVRRDDFEKQAIRHMVFSLRTFKNENEFTAISKLKTETEELEEALRTEQGVTPHVVEEYADNFLCLLSSMVRRGVTIGDLVEAMDKKNDKNRDRVWTQNPDGTYSHVKNPELNTQKENL